MLQSPPPPPPVQEVQETIVRAPRSNRTLTDSGISTQVIDRAELLATGERSLPKAISKASGLFVQETNLGGGAPILRGMIGNQVLIVVDGVRLNDSATRGGPNQSLNSIDPAAVERVEVLRGPTSVLYGSDALGGTILVWTRNRPAALRAGDEAIASRFEAELAADYNGSVRGASESVALSKAFAHDGILLTGSFHEWNELESAAGTVDNTGYHGQGAFGSWEHAFDREHRLRFSASRTRDFDVPRTDRLNVGFGQSNPSDSEHLFRVQDRERYQLTYTDESSGFTDAMQVRLSLRQYTERREIRRFNQTTRSLEQDEITTLGLGADWRKALGESQILTWGFDVDLDDVDSTRDNLNINTGVSTPAVGNFAPESEYLSSGVFLRDEIFAFEPFDVTAAVRYSFFDFGFEDPGTGNDVDGDFSAFTGSIGIGRELSPGVRVTANFAQGFRAPNLSELARNATFAGGTELANPDLDPEESLYQELALDVTREAWDLSLGVYHNDVSDVVGRVLVNDPTPGVPGDETYLRQNTGDLEFYGAEMRLRHRIGREGSPFRAGVYVEYTHGEQDDNFTGVDPAGKVPPLHGTVSLAYEAPGSKSMIDRAEVALLWAAEQDRLSPADLSDPRIDPNGTDSWTRVDFDLAGPLFDYAAHARWTFGVHNVFDEEYRVHGSGIDSPGVHVVAGMRVSL